VIRQVGSIYRSGLAEWLGMRGEGLTMFMQRVFTEGLAQASFVVGSDERHEAIVIDPRRDVGVYLDIAAAHDLRITHIYETHVHADYASGARELAARTGAVMHLSAIGESEFEHAPVHDGDVLEVGELRVQALLTPGHTPEHICLLVTDTAHPSEPATLFAGDAVFVGSVGRPDLLGEEQTRSLATALHHTIHDKLMALDDEIIVYPGHGAGSACGKAIGNDPSTTMGQEKRFNFAFQPATEAQFVEMILDGLPEPPPYFPVMKRLNKQGPQILGGIPTPDNLSVDDLRHAQQDDKILLDVRPAARFGEAFLAGSLNIGLEPSLPNWAGWAVSYENPIVLIVDDAADVEEAVTWLIRIGLDNVTGYAVADPDAWRAAGLAVESIEQIDPRAANARLATGDLQILDVRNVDEWNGGHVGGSHNVPVGPLVRGADGLDPSRPVAVMCAAGYRSSLGASVLKRRGYTDVINVTGGMDAWRAAGLPVE
jgi:hydroxyacylglutathione hydrolase